VSFDIIPLSAMMSKWTAEDIDTYLGSFSCERDRDLETFLRKKATEYEKRDLARTFLLVENESIIGYISLATTVLRIEEDWPVSSTLKKRMNILGGTATAFLIGQMCKADDVREKLGSYMISLAVMLFDGVREVCGGRVVCVDCKKDLLEFYERNGFKKINSPSESGLYRMVLLY